MKSSYESKGKSRKTPNGQSGQMPLVCDLWKTNVVSIHIYEKYLDLIVIKMQIKHKWVII